MLNIEQILASVGISGGAYGVYKVARRLYEKYYVNSECNHPNNHTTDIVVHISDISLEKPSDNPEGVPPLPSGLSSALQLTSPVNPLPPSR
jgi:hypothetical protein